MTDIIQNEIIQFASELPESIRIDEYKNEPDIYGVLSFKVPSHETTT